MTDSEAIWVIAYLIKLQRGDAQEDCSCVADTAKLDYEKMRESGDEK